MEARMKMKSISVVILSVLLLSGSLFADVIEDNLSRAKQFLDENKKKKGVVTLPTGLQYKVIQEGSGASPISNKDYVKIRFRGTLIDGTEFDNNEKKGTDKGFLMESLVPGMSDALLKMKPGSRWILYIPPNLAYGEKGVEGKIPPNALLIFDVKLLQINPPPDNEETDVIEFYQDNLQ